MMHHQQFLEHLFAHKTFDQAEMTALMQAIIDATLNPTQTAAILACLHMRGETAVEITAATQVIRQSATPCRIDNVIDIVGTGGDQSYTFNVSTASAIVAAAAGARVAKHGNRAVSSQSGSADLLQIAGVPLDLKTEQVRQCLEKLGITFLFAPAFHQAIHNVKAIRQALGVRTLFNIIAPLCNPTRPCRLLLGVFSSTLLKTVAEVLIQLDCEHAMVVHAEDGFDEISAFAPTHVVELKHGKIQQLTLNPADYITVTGQISDIQVENATQSLALIHAVFDNTAGAAWNMVVLNAGAAIYIAGLVPTLTDGVVRAATMIQSGLAKQKFSDFIHFSQLLKARE
jgi:anthranilate phosphoribosyltransferase